MQQASLTHRARRMTPVEGQGQAVDAGPTGGVLTLQPALQAIVMLYMVKTDNRTTGHRQAFVK